jgi:hypothetical protein
MRPDMVATRYLAFVEQYDDQFTKNIVREQARR